MVGSHTSMRQAAERPVQAAVAHLVLHHHLLALLLDRRRPSLVLLLADRPPTVVVRTVSLALRLVPRLSHPDEHRCLLQGGNDRDSPRQMLLLPLFFSSLCSFISL